MRRLIACALFAVLFALVGPRILGPQNRAAGASFAYEPPEGFVLLKPEALKIVAPTADGSQAQVWVQPEEPKNFDGSTPRLRKGLTRVIATHSTKEMSVEEPDLAKLAEEMPKAFETSDCTWVHRRHELRTRSDGARVGLIEGDCDRAVSEINPGVSGESADARAKPGRARKLQLMFPDDSGTSIVTASYPTEEAAKWEPVFEATIAKAHGVATRAPLPPPWTYGAWALAGAVLGWLATALIARRQRDADSPPVPATSSASKKKADADPAEEAG